MHVRGGVRNTTYRYPESSRLFTQVIRDAFPRDFFLTVQLQRTRNQQPHKDRQNAYLPTLLLNLSPGARGGTCIEDPQGHEWVASCSLGMDTCGMGLHRSFGTCDFAESGV